MAVYEDIKPDISVIIPTIGRDATLVNTLMYLSKQQHVVFEVIIIDQNIAMSPELESLLATDPGFTIHHCFQTDKNASEARNRGALLASSPIILFLDDDIIIEDVSFLAAHVKNYVDISIDGVAGQILAKDKFIRDTRHSWSMNNNYGWLYFPINYSCRVLLKGVGGAGNLSIRNELFMSIGGMDEQFEKGAFREESDFIQRCVKSGYSIVFDPACSLVHIGESTGGIRSWGGSDGVQQIHHVVGEWYFIFRHISFLNWFHYSVALLRRQIFNRVNVTHPTRFFRSILRSMNGAIEAIQKQKEGPKTLLNPIIMEKYSKRG